MTTRKKYTQEFKQDAVSLLTAQGYTPSEAARNLGIDRGMLSRWVKESHGDESEAFRGHGKLRAEQADLRRLREENLFAYPELSRRWRWRTRMRASSGRCWLMIEITNVTTGRRWYERVWPTAARPPA